MLRSRLFADVVRTVRLALLAWLSIHACHLFVLAQESAPKSQLDKQQQARLAERDKLWSEAQTLSKQGKREEALAAGEKVLKIEQELFGKHHNEMTYTVHWLISEYTKAKQLERANEKASFALELNTKLFGEDSWQVVSARNELDYLKRIAAQPREMLDRMLAMEADYYRLRDAGKHLQAAKIVQGLLELEKQVLGENHPFCANSIALAAESYVAAGEFAMAQPLSQKCVATRTKSLGAKHPDTASAMFTLARAQRGLKKFPDAVRSFGDAAAAYQAAGQDISAAYMSGWQGDTYRDAGKDETAVDAYRECVRRFEILKYDPGLASNARQLGAALVRLKRPADALPVFLAASKSYAASKRPADAAEMRSWIGDCHRELGDDKTAIEDYQQALEQFQSLKFDSGVAYTAWQLGQAQVRLKRQEAALPYFDIAAGAFERLKRPADIAQVNSAWARTQFQLKQFESAIPHFQTAAMAFEDSKRPVEAAWMHAWTGDCQRHLNDDRAAAQSYAECVRRFDELKQPEGLALNGENLAETLMRLERYGDAEPYFKKTAEVLDGLKRDDDAARVRKRLAECRQAKAARAAKQGPS